MNTKSIILFIAISVISSIIFEVFKEPILARSKPLLDRSTSLLKRDDNLNA